MKETKSATAVMIPYTTVLLFASLALASTLRGQTHVDLSLALANGELGIVQPGEVAVLSFKISRTSNAFVPYLFATDLPRDWRCLVGEGVFDLGNYESATRLVSFTVPRDAPAGRYSLRFQVRDYASGKELANLPVKIVVAPRYKITMKASEWPRFALAGSSYRVAFLLTNESNQSTHIRLRPRSIPHTALTMDSSEVSLLPGESRTIQVDVATDPPSRGQYRHALDLQARVLADTAVQGRASALVTVLPAVSGSEDIARYPMLLTLRWSGENSQKGGQVELLSSGTLSDPTDTYELLLRGPNNRTQSFLGQRDEYRLAYRNSALDIVAGDQAYQLSPLTEFGRYAFGLRSSFRFDQMVVGGFVNQTRWSTARWEERAAHATYSFQDGGTVGINFLRKEDDMHSNIVTLQSNFKAFEKGSVAVELGGSRSPNGNGNALSVTFGSRTDRIVYSFNQVYADPQYAGFYRDFDARTFTLVVFPWEKIRFEGYFRDEKRNLDKLAEQLYAPQIRQYQAGIGYGSYASASLRVTQQIDRLPSPKYDREETVGLLRLGANFTSANIVAHLDFGQTRESLLGKSYPLQRFALSTNFQPDEHQGYSVSFEYASTKDLFTDDTRRGTSQNITAWYKPTRDLQIQLGLYRNITISPSPQSNTLAGFGIDYQLPFGHNVSLEARINRFTASDAASDAAFSLEYTIPLQVAFSKGDPGGTLSGKIRDLESGHGIPNVVLYAGERVAVSDEDGNFTFPYLKEEVYIFSIDRSTIGPEKITTAILPLRVTMPPAKILNIDVGVTSSCSVVGRVSDLSGGENISGDSSLVEEHPVHSIRGTIIELRSGSEVFRRAIDRDGRFRFQDLRPGKWTLSVIEGEAETRFQESSVQTIELKAGENRQVQFTRVSEQRKIQYLERGGVLKQK